MANKMMGVVLWSDTKDEKAVFWCEDHGDLAYFNTKSVSQVDIVAFQPGDMVQFDITVERKTRRAHNARIVEQKVCDGLQDGLRQGADRGRQASPNIRKTGNVIPFHEPIKTPLLNQKLGNG